jgi:putative heme-binding domain-containing protein
MNPPLLPHFGFGIRALHAVMLPPMKSLLCLFASVGAALAADPFAEGVRPTDPLTPQEQAKTFKLPPGFKIDLVAAEPDLFKPMNLAFDTKGRLWVTVSREYPFAAPLDKPGRDSIKVLEDFDENGRARKITTFADGLNIPIGLYPYKNGVIAWSIPNIWFFQDTDGDGKADKREVLFGPLGWERDTHGNQASFRRGYDGWLYITHGYNNISTVRGKDGSEIRMHSGNTYRVRLDGSRVEQHTFGQVNPFGLAFDPAGNLYSADCHSAPIYELLHGAYYPSFGKPHDGLGFGPAIMEHSHGSTAICGIMYYADDHWPEEYRNNIFIGNVMTSRINRDRLDEKGSTKLAVEMPDFLSTTDPWFRPVDLQLGPDGALYIADFYNRIIGHYEVPLTHPGRDFERARIWRVTYTGKPARDLANFAKMSPAQLTREFASPNPTRRMLAMTEFTDRVGENDRAELERILDRSNASPDEIVHALWTLQRLNGLDAERLRKFTRHSDRTVRVHVMRILAEVAGFDTLRQNAAVQALRDSDGQVQRTAAEALARNPEPEVYIRPLLALLEKVPAEDVQLRHMTRLALRNQFASGGPALSYRRYKPAEASVIADLCLAIPNEQAATFLLEHIQAHPGATPKTAEYVRHASRYIPAEGAENLAKFVRTEFKNDIDQQLAFFKAIQEGSAQRGATLGTETRGWGSDLAARLIASAGAEEMPWWNVPLPQAKVTTNPWFLQKRASQDGNQHATFLCSLPPGGEHFTGTLRSRPFNVPARLSFYFAGHDGVPTSPAPGNNFVRLVSAEDGRELARAVPPRNDIAQRVEWNLSEHAGKKAFLELTDGDTGSGYAWIAVGRLEPAVVPMPRINPNQISARLRSAADIARTLQVASLTPDLNRLIGSPAVDDEAQAAVASALAALEPTRERLMLAPILADNTVPADLRRALGVTFSDKNASAVDVLASALRSSPARVEMRLAQNLAGSAAGVETLLELVEKGHASPRIFLDKNIEAKVKAGASPAVQQRLGKLTANLEPASEVVQKQLEQLRAAFNPAKASLAEGARVFTQNCAVCHQIDGAGAIVGPQLDGIGGRGLERLLEDILDPNRNVDVNFRSQTLVLKDGDVVSGVFRREEGGLVILADSTGKEISVPKAEIESTRESESSIMPSNFGDVIPEKDFQDMLAFLLSKTAAR